MIENDRFCVRQYYRGNMAMRKTLLFLCEGLGCAIQPSLKLKEYRWGQGKTQKTRLVVGKAVSYGGNMKKIVTISGKEYSMQSSAYTQFKYKNETGRSLLKDLESLTSHTEKEIINNVDDLLEMLLKISYIMIVESDDKQAASYDNFLKSLDALFDDSTWINDVLELAVSPISRGIQKASPNQQ